MCANWQAHTSLLRRACAAKTTDLALPIVGGVVGVCIVQGNLVSASNDSFIKVWNSTGNQRPFTAK